MMISIYVFLLKFSFSFSFSVLNLSDYTLNTANGNFSSWAAPTRKQLKPAAKLQLYDDARIKHTYMGQMAQVCLHSSLKRDSRHVHINQRQLTSSTTKQIS